jgi:hypothetical protein
MEGYSYKVLSKYRVVQDARTYDHHVPCEWKWKRGGAAETLSALHPFLLCRSLFFIGLPSDRKRGKFFNTVQYMALLFH